MKLIDVFYQGERIQALDQIEADADETLSAIKARLTAKHQCEADALLFLEDADEPLDEDTTVGEFAGKGGAKLHLHRCRRIEVAVRFAGKTLNHQFGPGATIARVKRWAAEQLHMSKEDAGEHVLQISGTQERPAPSIHVGSLVTCPACKISFDLVPDERVNGSPEVSA